MNILRTIGPPPSTRTRPPTRSETPPSTPTRTPITSCRDFGTLRGAATLDILSLPFLLRLLCTVQGLLGLLPVLRGVHVLLQTLGGEGGVQPPCIFWACQRFLAISPSGFLLFHRTVGINPLGEDQLHTFSEGPPSSFLFPLRGKRKEEGGPLEKGWSWNRPRGLSPLSDFPPEKVGVA